MTIHYGSIEYFGLLKLRDSLKSRQYQKFDLPSFEKLKYEIEMMVEVIHEREKQRNKTPTNEPIR